MFTISEFRGGCRLQEPVRSYDLFRREDRRRLGLLWCLAGCFCGRAKVREHEERENGCRDPCRNEATGDPSVAEGPVRQAIARFDAIGAVAISATLRARVRPLGIAMRPARPRSTSALSEMELAVARLTVSGRTNREIGEQLHMSARTVESHLGRVFARVGVKNRVELTRQFSSQLDGREEITIELPGPSPDM